MKILVGLDEYLKENYRCSVFDSALQSGKEWVLHLHGYEILQGRLVENGKYDILFAPSSNTTEGGTDRLTLPKLSVKLLYPAEIRVQVAKAIKTDARVAGLRLLPIPEPSKRYHVKNKSLYPLMRGRVVVFFTLLEGEMVRGLVADFSRYEVTLNLKGGLPVTILRHAVYNVVDKEGTCYLKTVQEKRQDWCRSPLAQDANPQAGKVKPS